MKDYSLFSPEALSVCRLCPHDCEADRKTGLSGFCRTGDAIPISSICRHMGEEPVLSGRHGICNIFFAHCNLQCVYCQNYQISSNRESLASVEMLLEEVVDEVEMILDQGARGVGFVSPSHCLVQMQAIIRELQRRGRQPTFVYNTNGYDRVETIRYLEDSIGVFLPDMKYMDNSLAREYSQVDKYVEYAADALVEMFRQKGADLQLDEDGYVTDGLIIRHLVLPGQVDNSIRVLEFIAEHLSTDVHISLMAQYHPTPAVRGHPVLGRFLKPEEYDRVLRAFEALGFHRGWVQDLSSPSNYLPDFDKGDPFE